MAIAYTNMVEGGNVGASSVSTAGNLTPTNNLLYLGLAFAAHAGGVGSDPTCAGGGMTTWTNAKSFDYSGATRKLTIFRSLQASVGSPAVVTTTYGGSLDELYLVIFEVTGMETGGTNGSGAVKDTNSDTDTGTGTSVTQALAALTSSDCDALMWGAHTVWFEAWSAGAGMSSLMNGGSGGGGTNTCHLLKGTNVTAPSASWATSEVFGSIALEIVAAGAAAVPLTDPRMTRTSRETSW